MKRLLLLCAVALFAFVTVVLVRGDHGADIATARPGAEGKFIALQDGIVHYELEGPATAPTVVFVHGFATPYYVWDPTYKAVRYAGFRVLRYDLYGRGYSDRPQRDYDLDLFDRQLTHLLSALQISGPVHIVGLSMGGLISTSFADRHPEFVRSLTLVDTAGFPVPIPPVANLVRLPLVGELAMWTLGPRILLATAPRNFRHPEKFTDFATRYATQLQYEGFLRAILSTMRHMPLNHAQDIFERVGKRSIPTLVFWGRDDQVVPYADTALILKALPSAQLVTIEDAGHLSHYEKPGEVSPRLVSFLLGH